MPNHFHLLVRIKDFADLPESERVLIPGSKKSTAPEAILSERFRRFFFCYSKSINIQETRTGSLFEKNFRRKYLDSEVYFTNLIAYIHRNPKTHSICDEFEAYSHNSYGRMWRLTPGKLMKLQVLAWFGGSEYYRKFHNERPALKLINHLLIDE